tara:strand:- start:97 stop:1425 length:1329 start_codon:yes stop_codon:yes gene_type:complete
MPKLRGVPSRQDTLTVSAAIRGRGATSAEGTLIKSTGETVDTKFLRTDGDGTCSWQTPAGGGNVSTSGTPALNEFAKFVNATSIEGRNYTETKSDLSLGNVENTAISNWAGTSNVTTLGTISTGVWEGSVIDAAYLDLSGAGASPWTSGSGKGYWTTLSDDIGIGTATPAAKLHVSGTTLLSGNTAITGTLDISSTIDSGEWNGTAIADTYIASEANWNSAYDNYVASAAYSAGTLTFTQRDGGTFTATGFDIGDVTGGGADTYISYWTAAANITGTSDFVRTATGIGIDTTPAYKLHVAGDFNLGSSVTLTENSNIGTISGTAFQYTVEEATYIYDIHGGFTAAVIGYGNYYIVKPASPGVLPSAIPVTLPDGSSEVGMKITIAQPVDADPEEALAVAAQGGDVIYEGASNSASATVTIASYRGANKTFLTIAAGVWMVVE